MQTCVYVFWLWSVENGCPELRSSFPSWTSAAWTCTLFCLQWNNCRKKKPFPSIHATFAVPERRCRVRCSEMKVAVQTGEQCCERIRVSPFFSMCSFLPLRQVRNPEAKAPGLGGVLPECLYMQRVLISPSTALGKALRHFQDTYWQVSLQRCYTLECKCAE